MYWPSENGQRTNNGRGDTTQKTKDQTTSTSIKTVVILGAPEGLLVPGTCLTSDTDKSWGEERRTGLLVRQTEHVHGHL